MFQNTFTLDIMPEQTEKKNTRDYQDIENKIQMLELKLEEQKRINDHLSNKLDVMNGTLLEDINVIKENNELRKKQRLECRISEDTWKTQIIQLHQKIDKLLDVKPLIKFFKRVDGKLNYLKSKLIQIERKRCLPRVDLNRDFNALKTNFDNFKSHSLTVQNCCVFKEHFNGKIEKISRNYDTLKIRFGAIEREVMKNTSLIYGMDHLVRQTHSAGITMSRGDCRLSSTRVNDCVPDNKPENSTNGMNNFVISTAQPSKNTMGLFEQSSAPPVPPASPGAPAAPPVPLLSSESEMIDESDTYSRMNVTAGMLKNVLQSPGENPKKTKKPSGMNTPRDLKATKTKSFSLPSATAVHSDVLCDLRSEIQCDDRISSSANFNNPTNLSRIYDELINVFSLLK